MGDLIRFPIERRLDKAVDLAAPQVVQESNGYFRVQTTGWSGFAMSSTAAKPVDACGSCGEARYENLVHHCQTSRKADPIVMPTLFPLESPPN